MNKTTEIKSLESLSISELSSLINNEDIVKEIINFQFTPRADLFLEVENVAALENKSIDELYRMLGEELLENKSKKTPVLVQPQTATEKISNSLSYHCYLRYPEKYSSEQIIFILSEEIAPFVGNDRKVAAAILFLKIQESKERSEN